jgi:hypothetical protein
MIQVRFGRTHEGFAKSLTVNAAMFTVSPRLTSK